MKDLNVEFKEDKMSLVNEIMNIPKDDDGSPVINKRSSRYSVFDNQSVNK